jgi:hypothetical protein
MWGSVYVTRLRGENRVFSSIHLYHSMAGDNRLRRFIFLVLVSALLVSLKSFAQKVDAVLQQLAFLSGRWTSDSAEGDEEEYWSQPMGESMVGTFRVVKDGKAVFYEFWAIEVEDGKAIFKMKHFDRGLLGWEEKADMVRLTAKIGDGQDVLFSKPDGSLTLRYERKGDELVSTLRRVKDGKAKEDVFRLHRSK